MSLDAEVDEMIESGDVELFLSDKVFSYPDELTGVERKAIDLYGTIATAIKTGNWRQAERHLRKLSTKTPKRDRMEVQNGGVNVEDYHGEVYENMYSGTRQRTFKTSLSPFRHALPSVITAGERDRIISVYERLVEARHQTPISFRVDTVKKVIVYNF